MRYSQLLLKTNKEAKEFDSINATLLQKGGFIDQTMAGVYTFLPLGLRVLTNIENIVRAEMNTIGTELLMPSLSPRSLWKTTDRLNTIDVLFEARGGNDLSRHVNDASYVLNSTHEELITPIVQHLKPSYKDLPLAVYQIQTKFRNEPRPKSGLLRGREFRMKDLYSFHTSEDDFRRYYEQVKAVYMRVFDRVGLGGRTFITKASGGAFTKEYSHEFNTICETGEDTIYLDESTGEYYNKEVARPALQAASNPLKASEVGNIFPLGRRFSEAFGYYVTDHEGKEQPVFMGSYGLGTSRIMGVLAEIFHDDRGLLWPQEITPFHVHLVSLQQAEADGIKQAEDVYATLQEAGLDVLFDDRAKISAGEKLADADLIGIPWRVVVSKKTGRQIEIKHRSKPEAALQDISSFIQSLPLTPNKGGYGTHQ